jgi:hypothetical protein
MRLRPLGGRYWRSAIRAGERGTDVGRVACWALKGSPQAAIGRLVKPSASYQVFGRNWQDRTRSRAHLKSIAKGNPVRPQRRSAMFKDYPDHPQEFRRPSTLTEA